MEKLRSMIFARLGEIVGVNNITEGKSGCKYSMDSAFGLHIVPLYVVKPSSVEEVSQIITICNENGVKVSPRGGGTGVTGGSLQEQTGIVLSLERMNKIYSIDSANRRVIVEAGVISEHLEKAVREKGFVLPALPSSKGTSFIGGNVSTASGSPSSAKYGKIGKYVENLQVVLPNGQIIWTGANVTKSTSGIDLTSLFVGSEGLLGIITKVAFKLLIPPAVNHVLFATFRSVENAIKCIDEIILKRYTPESLEIIFDRAYNEAIKGSLLKQYKGYMESCAGLIIGLEGDSNDSVWRQCNGIMKIIGQFTENEVLLANSERSKEVLSNFREQVIATFSRYPAGHRDIDVCVPRASLLTLIKGYWQLCNDLNIKTYSFGHAVDGNIHIMVLYDENKAQDIKKFIDELYALAIDLGGVISGEHGIGRINAEYFGRYIDPKKIELMKKIKRVFDPKEILSNGKVI